MTVNASQTVFFILKNVGSYPITNVQLVPQYINTDGTYTAIANTDNSFVVSPGTITNVDTSANSSIETLISISINHGQVLGLNSQENVITRALNGVSVHITGDTKDVNGQPATTSLDADLTTLVNYAQFKITIGGTDQGWVTSTSASGRGTVTNLGNKKIIGGGAKSSGPMVFVNTGTVDVKIATMNVDQMLSNLVRSGGSVVWTTVPKGGSLDITQYFEGIVSPTNTFSSTESFIEVDTGGVTLDDTVGAIGEHLLYQAGTSVTQPIWIATGTGY